jgi:hypothetical protein
MRTGAEGLRDLILALAWGRSSAERLNTIPRPSRRSRAADDTDLLSTSGTREALGLDNGPAGRDALAAGRGIDPAMTMMGCVSFALLGARLADANA